LLQSAGVPLRVGAISADESLLAGEVWSVYLERVVAAKLEHAEELNAQPEHRDCPAVLVADTVVVVDGAVLGKPVDAADSARMLRLLSGRDHEVSTRFALRTREGETLARTVTTKVTVRPLSAQEVANYVASKEGDDKAGGYAIQGGFSFAVRSIAGSYACVVGLPICEVVEGLQALRLWAA
jgi:septum formation protein